jgi:hypothetical protein
LHLLMGRLHIWALLHRCSGDSRSLSLMNCRFRVHAFDGDNVSEVWVGGWLWELRRVWVRSRVVAD